MIKIVYYYHSILVLINDCCACFQADVLANWFITRRWQGVVEYQRQQTPWAGPGSRMVIRARYCGHPCPVVTSADRSQPAVSTGQSHAVVPRVNSQPQGDQKQPSKRVFKNGPDHYCCLFGASGFTAPYKIVELLLQIDIITNVFCLSLGDVKCDSAWN